MTQPGPKDGISSTLIEAGFYYEKKRTPGWLRLSLGIVDGRMAYVDFSTVGACDCATLARWSGRRLSLEEAATEFPHEIRKIERVRRDAIKTMVPK